MACRSAFGVVVVAAAAVLVAVVVVAAVVVGPAAKYGTADCRTAFDIVVI